MCDEQGGVAYIGGGTFSAEHCTFSENSASHGGAVYLASGVFFCQSCIFDQNKVDNNGGALAIQNFDLDGREYTQQSYVWNSTFTGNRAKGGGAIAISQYRDDYFENHAVHGLNWIDKSFFKGQLVVQDGIFRNNTASSANGGDVFSIATHPSQGEALFDNCRVEPDLTKQKATYAIDASSVVVLRGRVGGYDMLTESWGQPDVRRLASRCNDAIALGPPNLRRGTACPERAPEEPKFDVDPVTNRQVPHYVTCGACTDGDVVDRPFPRGTLPKWPALNWACSCPEGKFLQSDTTYGTARCISCQPGSKCASNARTACDRDNEFQDEFEQSECKVCNATTHVRPGGSHTMCTAKKACVAGEHVLAPGNSTQDRVCSKCQAGLFSSTSNAAMCAV